MSIKHKPAFFNTMFGQWKCLHVLVSRQVLKSKHRKCWYWDRSLVNFCSCLKGYTSTIVLKTDRLFIQVIQVLCTDSNYVKTISVHMDQQKLCHFVKKYHVSAHTHTRLNMYFSQIWVFEDCTKNNWMIFKNLHFKTRFKKFAFSDF